MIPLFHDLDAARLERKISLRTVSLDHFAAVKGLGPVDLIKVDVQGAELDVFEGGRKTLQDTLLICSEVEFTPIYEKQPLFGDVTTFLSARGFSFHRFLNLHGRCVKPIKLTGSPSQHLWGDAIYTRDFLRLESLSADQLLKLAVLLESYGSPDAAHWVLQAHDDRKKTRLASSYLQALTRPPPSA